MSANFVQVTTTPVEVTIKSSGQTVVVPSSKKVYVVTVGKVGPSGPAGADADTSFEWATQTLNLVAPQQEFELDFTPRAGSVFVYLNGLLERFWNLTGTTVALDEPAITGDVLVISYQKET